MKCPKIFLKIQSNLPVLCFLSVNFGLSFHFVSSATPSPHRSSSSLALNSYTLISILVAGHVGFLFHLVDFPFCCKTIESLSPALPQVSYTFDLLKFHDFFLDLTKNSMT